MSLSRLALRTLTVKALTGATLAGQSVYDSAVDPINMQVLQNRKPFLVVTTDEHKRTVTGRDLRHGTDMCELVIEVAVASKVEAEGADGQIVIPQTDAGMEVILDLIGAQITEALMSGATVWSQLWADFVLTVVSVNSRRGAGAEEGIRFAARQIIITCDILADPVRGQALTAGGTWGRLLAAMDADVELAGIGSLIQYAIEGEAILTEEAFIASLYGISAETVDALGLTPVRNAQGAKVDLDEVVVDQEAGLPDMVLKPEEG